MPWLLVIEDQQEWEGSISAGQEKENSKRPERVQKGEGRGSKSWL